MKSCWLEGTPSPIAGLMVKHDPREGPAARARGGFSEELRPPCHVTPRYSLNRIWNLDSNLGCSSGKRHWNLIVGWKS